jgi:hypothetical protein
VASTTHGNEQHLSLITTVCQVLERVVKDRFQAPVHCTISQLCALMCAAASCVTSPGASYCSVPCSADCKHWCPQLLPRLASLHSHWLSRAHSVVLFRGQTFSDRKVSFVLHTEMKDDESQSCIGRLYQTGRGISYTAQVSCGCPCMESCRSLKMCSDSTSDPPCVASARSWLHLWLTRP